MFDDALNNGGAIIAGAAFVSLLSGAIGGEEARKMGCNSYMALEMGIECMFVE
jgi:hypothetical protein